MAYCNAWPGKIVLTNTLSTDALKWQDISFYLTLWDNNKEEQDNNLQEAKALLIDIESQSQDDPPSCHSDGSQAPPHSQTKFHLGCKVKIRNLKGGQLDPTKWQLQPLYNGAAPACMQAILLLAQLAELGVFAHSISIASVMESANPEYFRTEEFLPISMKPDMADRSTKLSLLRHRCYCNLRQS